MSEAVRLSCVEFVEALASRAPAPGGGGAAALVGAVGAALGNMVGSLTVGKAAYAEVQDDIAALNERAQALQGELLALVARDAQVFEPLAAAYGLPRDTEEQRAHKAQVMEGCLLACCEVPLQVMRACAQAISLCDEYARKGSRLAVSDAGCGAVVAKAACQAASLNVFINTKSMTDTVRAQELNAEARGLLDAACAQADAVFARVEGSLT